MTKADYRLDEIKNKNGDWCVVPSAAWKREMMTPNLDAVSSPLSTQIWRYMSFGHFTQCIRTSQFYYPRVDLLGDPLEGSFSVDMISEETAWLQNRPESSRAQLQESKRKLRQETMQRLFYVSCWHINHAESELHWKRYGERHQESVAVASTIGALCTNRPNPVFVDELEFTPKISAGEVCYVDHAVPSSVPKDKLSLYYKAEHFKHDAEFRSIVELWSMGWSQHGHPNLPDGVLVEIAPGAIFDFIVPAPGVSGLKEKVQAVLDEFGYRIPINESALQRKPYW